MKSMTPILFQPQLVRSILDGVKDTTRRDPIVVPAGYAFDRLETAPGPKGKEKHFAVFAHPTLPELKKPIRFFKGQVLYVRETFLEHKGHYYYKADGKHETLDALIIGSFFKWRPSIHMPKEAARLFLQVQDVRIERLQDITEEQAVREGVSKLFPPSERLWRYYKGNKGKKSKMMCFCSECKHCDLSGMGCTLMNAHCYDHDCRYEHLSTVGCNTWFELREDSEKEPARYRFYYQWNQIPGKEGTDWAANPYVVVVEFTRISKDEAAALEGDG